MLTSLSISTGTLIDRITGVGGIPRKGITEIFGDSGPTRQVVLRTIAGAQESGSIVVFIDGGNGLDLEQARGLGVDLDSLLVCQPRTLDEALEIAHACVRTGLVGLVVVDAMHLLPVDEVLSTVGGYPLTHGAMQFIARTFRVMSVDTSTRRCAVVFSGTEPRAENHDGHNMGSNGLKFYSVLRIKLRGGDPEAGPLATTVKNKLAAPMQAAFLHGTAPLAPI